jgi:hypothetical protein
MRRQNPTRIKSITVIRNVEQLEPGLYKWLAGATANIDGEAMEVLPGCGKNNGHWHCTAHPREFFRNNMAKDSHIADRSEKHYLVWVCYEHGAEQP